MRLPAAALTAALLLAAASPAQAGDARLAPLPPAEALVVHGPYEQGACDTCHARADRDDPGPARVAKETCLACHDEFGGKAPVRVGKGKSHPIKGECTACHNPHNARKKKLLL
ncbi:MAG: cytochrome c3 family protein [Anaeromyxobacter sp.]|nr:cytochrome c3 family protein [Anaeromyxobacter sp.]MBL0275640.1 cytochrome c3 family protein [Anaeromyxobacter sp.]